MLRTLYGEITNGRLKRLPYLGYHLLVSAVGVAAVHGIDATVGLFARLAQGGLPAARAALWGEFGALGLVLIAAFLGVLFLVQINLAAKRIRDIGLPGWWLILSIGVLAFFTYIVGGSPLVSGVNLLIFLSLLILPSDAFGKYEAPPSH